MQVYGANATVTVEKQEAQLLLRDRHHHHHHEQAPGWSVAVSTRCFQCSRSWVYFHAELRPRLRGWRSASRVHSQVWRGRPGGRLQSLGNPLIETLSALVMSSDVSILATCPKNRSRLACMSCEPAWSLTVALVTWSVYGMRKTRRKHILSKATTFSPRLGHWRLHNIKCTGLNNIRKWKVRWPWNVG